jgi:hypothetical protein
MFRLRAPLTTLLVLSAYLAAHTLGALVHESLHAHSHAGDCQHVHVHHQHPQGCTPSESQPAEEGWSGLADTHQHDCVVCQVTGQPIITPAPASVTLIADVCQDAVVHAACNLPAQHARISQARAPPLLA